MTVDKPTPGNLIATVSELVDSVNNSNPVNIAIQLGDAGIFVPFPSTAAKSFSPSGITAAGFLRIAADSTFVGAVQGYTDTSDDWQVTFLELDIYKLQGVSGEGDFLKIGTNNSSPVVVPGPLSNQLLNSLIDPSDSGCIFSEQNTDSTFTLSANIYPNFGISLKAGIYGLTIWSSWLPV